MGHIASRQSCQQAKQSKFSAQLGLIDPKLLMALT
jgi:hypothetical protein